MHAAGHATRLLPARAHEQGLTASIFRKCGRDGRRDECLQAILSTTQATEKSKARNGGSERVDVTALRRPLYPAFGETPIKADPGAIGGVHDASRAGNRSASIHRRAMARRC